MVDGFHIPVWNRTKKSLAIALDGVEKGLRGRDDEGNVNNVQISLTGTVTLNSPHIMLIKNFT
jgi:hypothetical protein